jgi:hypothetical protein
MDTRNSGWEKRTSGYDTSTRCQQLKAVGGGGGGGGQPYPEKLSSRLRPAREPCVDVEPSAFRAVSLSRSGS